MIRATLLLLVIPISGLVQAGLTSNPDISTRVDMASEECGVYSALIQGEFVDQFKSMVGTEVSFAVIYNETHDARPIDYEGDYDHELIDYKTLELWRPNLKSSMPALARRTIEDFYSRNGQPESLCDSFDLSVSHALVGRDELDSLNQLDRLEPDRLELDEAEDATFLNAFQKKYSGAAGLICLSRAGFNSKMNQALVYAEILDSIYCPRAFFVLLVKEDGLWKIRADMLAWIS